MSAGPDPTPTGSDPAGTLEWLMRRLDLLGISRLGDITGLDRIGIPVVQAVRPLGLANAVTQGKGPDVTTAAISAIMEAAEQAFAERIERFSSVAASAAALGIPQARFARHLLPDAPAGWHDLPTAWVAAEDLLSADAGWLPLELVHTAYVDPPAPTDGLFCASTTGLACGFDVRKAILHGLLECIERDAIAAAQRTHGFFQRFRIDPATIGDGPLESLMDRVRAAGLACAFWSAPAVAAVPVIWCQVMEDGSRPPIMPYAADGFAADPDPVSAARAALLEAAQSRLAAIAGARDDITRAAFPRHPDWDSIESHRRLLADGPLPVRFASLQMQAGPPGGDALDRVVGLLAAAGIASVLWTRIESLPCAEIVTVRVIVPALSPLAEG